MKRSLGSLLLLFIQLLFVHAEDFTYDIHADNPHPYVKEAVVVTLELNQTNDAVVLFFDFDIKPSPKYTFQRVSIEEQNMHHDLKVRYTYLLYPLQAGDIDIDFILTKKVTTDDSLAYSFSGDRDNVKKLVTKNYPIHLTPLKLAVRALPKGTSLVGDFSLDYKIKTYQAKVYEAIPLQVILKGKGYPPLLDSLLPKDINVTLFTEEPIVESNANTQGTQSKVTYPMALSHAQSFTLPAIELLVFNPKTQTPYTLTLPEQRFEISQIPKEALLDKRDTPAPLHTDWSWLKVLLGYLAVFWVGFLSAKVIQMPKRSKEHRTDPLIDKLEKSKDAKYLLQLLIAHDTVRFRTTIEKLENALYQNAKIDIGKIKQEILEEIK